MERDPYFETTAEWGWDIPCEWPLCDCQPHDCCEGMEALCEEPKRAPSTISKESPK